MAMNTALRKSTTRNFLFVSICDTLALQIIKHLYYKIIERRNI